MQLVFLSAFKEINIIKMPTVYFLAKALGKMAFST
jgi:hypothetical protein